MGRRGAERQRVAFTIDVAVGRLDALYQQVLAERRARLRVARTPPLR
jgi:hypothetical protein